MKSSFFNAVKRWLGYTRRERRSSFILLMLILVITAVRFMFHGKAMDIEISGSGIIISKDDPAVTGLHREHGERSEYAGQAAVLEINTCDSALLEALPGIGPVLASRIIKFRNLLNGYASVDQLREVYGLSEETFNRISGRLRCDPSLIRKININNADFKQLIRLPYFERNEVTAILRYRQLQGRIEAADDLVENKILSAEKTEKVKPYLDFGTKPGDVPSAL